MASVSTNPEFLGKKIRGPQMKLVIAGGLIYFPMLILGPFGERIVG
jgi:K+-transporting ATPase A subunit